jgi:hypothetical protein
MPLGAHVLTGVTLDINHVATLQVIRSSWVGAAGSPHGDKTLQYRRLKQQARSSFLVTIGALKEYL